MTFRVFGELRKDGEGEQPEALGIRIALGQRHFRRRLDGLRRIEGDQLALGDRLGAGRRQVEGRHALAVLVDGARGGLRRRHLGLGNAEIAGLDLALALVGLGAAGRRARMAAVEDGPDEGALVADRVERRADLVVHQRVGHALVAVDPLVDVLRQEDFVEPVGLVAGLGLRLLRAMARQMQIDEVVALHLAGKVGERRGDLGMGRRAIGAVDAVGQQRDVLRRELDRRREHCSADSREPARHRSSARSASSSAAGSDSPCRRRAARDRCATAAKARNGTMPAAVSAAVPASNVRRVSLIMIVSQAPVYQAAYPSAAILSVF